MAPKTHVTSSSQQPRVSRGPRGVPPPHSPVAERSARVAAAIVAIPSAVVASVIGWGLDARTPFVLDALHLLCAQAPTRALVLNGEGLPLCARCTGLWVGALIGASVAAVRSPIARDRLPRSWIVSAGAFAIGLADGLARVLTPQTWDTPAALRVVSGGLLGAGGGYLIVALAATVLASLEWDRCNRDRGSVQTSRRP